MLGIIIMISNYFHDLAVAILAASVLATYYIGRFLDDGSFREKIIPRLFGHLKIVTYWALAYVLAGGAVRAFFFMDYEWNPAVGKGQVAALIIKHVILVTLTIFGIIIHLRYQRKYGINR